MSGFKRKGGDSGGKGKSIRENKDADRMENDVEEDDDVVEGLAFEDPFEDEFEEEERDEDDQDIDEDEDSDEDEDGNVKPKAKTQQLQDEDDEDHVKKQVWRPGIDQLEDGETLEYDPSAYIMYHQVGVEWPCLTFDILRDTLGDSRSRFPHTMFMATGSQADRVDHNKITLLSIRELHKTFHDEEDGSEDDEDLDDDPVLDHMNIPHRGGINRLRSCPQQPGLIATMADDGKAHIFDACGILSGMMNPGSASGLIPKKPTYTFHKHTQEGFALDWSPKDHGRLATGDCAGSIYVWQMGSNTQSWNVDLTPYSGHKGSVEDIQWSPTEATVFISSSTDKTFKIWDIRAKTAQISVDAHLEDVNVISWSRTQSYLLASGCDDGSFKVWDLRAVRECKALANFSYHKGPVTSIDWAPHDESVLGVASADNQVTVWDLSVEADEDPASAEALSHYPAQLLFIHQGQSNVKELHHHPHIPGMIVTTAEDGFNVFKPAITVQT